MSNYTANITFTNGTTLTFDTTTYTDNSTVVNGNTITIGGTTIGTGGITIGTGTGTNTWPLSPYTYPTTYPNVGGGVTVPYQPLQPLDGYGIFPFMPEPKKGADVLVDELKSSIFSELDRYIDALSAKKELDKDFDSVKAKAEMMHEMLALASEMIKERLDKLKEQQDKILSE